MIKVAESKKEEMARLMKGVSPKARVPGSIGLWSEAMVLAWLRQNQRKPRKGER